MFLWLSLSKWATMATRFLILMPLFGTVTVQMKKKNNFIKRIGLSSSQKFPKTYQSKSARIDNSFYKEIKALLKRMKKILWKNKNKNKKGKTAKSRSFHLVKRSKYKTWLGKFHRTFQASSSHWIKKHHGSWLILLNNYLNEIKS